MTDLRPHLLTDGYLILRGVIDPSRLEAVRGAFETLVDRQREIWRRDRGSEDPPGGVWETAAQPRLTAYDGLVDDPSTAAAVEVILDRPQAVSARIMGAPVAPTQFMMMCNPVRDHGPAAWHRDIHPIDQAPVRGLQQDLLAHGPGYLQWNLPLHDDSVLWVIPGSHARANTDEENRLLADDPRRPLPGSLRVELAAGDAVVYTNLILHWGSDYSARRRRTVHFGFRSFGGDLLPYVLGLHRGRDCSAHLSAAAQADWARHRALYLEECERLEAALRAAIAGDGPGFVDAVARLHPGAQHREVCLVLLSKLARKMVLGDHPERPGYGGDFTQERELAPRFTADELTTLWSRLAPVDQMLKAPTGETFVPGYQSGPMSYRFEEMPEGLSVEGLVAGWR